MMDICKEWVYIRLYKIVMYTDSVNVDVCLFVLLTVICIVCYWLNVY